jgi:hypothetical protein
MSAIEEQTYWIVVDEKGSYYHSTLSESRDNAIGMFEENYCGGAIDFIAAEFTGYRCIQVRITPIE